MKNLSLLLNFVLVLAVTFLYYLHFSEKQGVANEVQITKETLAPIQVMKPKEIKASSIVYVNADSLFDNYEYVKKLKKETESKHSNLEAEYNAKAKKLQEDYVAYQQKISQALITPEQAKKTEDDLMRRKDELEQMQEKQDELLNETQKKNAQIQKTINDFLAAYNKNVGYNFVLAYTQNGGSVLFANDSLDITKEVLEGLNANYKKAQEKK